MRLEALATALSHGPATALRGRWCSRCCSLLGQGNLAPTASRATGWLLVGLVQTVAIVAARPASAGARSQPVTDRRARCAWTCSTPSCTASGLFRLAMFFTLERGLCTGSPRSCGRPRAGLAARRPVARGDRRRAGVSFLLYLVVFDLRGLLAAPRRSTACRPWWQLHALHHSQRQMTMWSDNRNHLLDDLIRDARARGWWPWCMGMAPGQFVAMVAVTQLLESLSACQRAAWPSAGGRAPAGEPAASTARTTRSASGTSPAGRGTLGAATTACCCPGGTMLFGTARLPAGLRAQPACATSCLPRAGATTARGFWSQQWRGLLRVAGRA
jgi:sterol desaturase/sphingolipid hydroxylase (fatty acid hydroxylase superfamily)